MATIDGRPTQYGVSLKTLRELMEHRGREGIARINEIGGVQELCKKLYTSPNEGKCLPISSYHPILIFSISTYYAGAFVFILIDNHTILLCQCVIVLCCTISTSIRRFPLALLIFPPLSAIRNMCEIHTHTHMHIRPLHIYNGQFFKNCSFSSVVCSLSL